VHVINGPNGFELVMGYFAEVGGDPEQYGLFLQDEGRGFESMTPDEEASTLRAYLETGARVGSLDAEVAAAVQSGSVDWHTVMDSIRSMAWAPPSMP
jgi:hypothetical protein